MNKKKDWRPLGGCGVTPKTLKRRKKSWGRLGWRRGSARAEAGLEGKTHLHGHATILVTVVTQRASVSIFCLRNTAFGFYASKWNDHAWERRAQLNRLPEIGGWVSLRLTKERYVGTSPSISANSVTRSKLGGWKPNRIWRTKFRTRLEKMLSCFNNRATLSASANANRLEI